MNRLSRFTSSYLRSYALRFSFLVLLLLSACNRAAPTPSATPPPATVTAVPVTATPDAPSPTPVPPATRPQYTLDLQLDYANKAAQVNETIDYTNQSADTLTSLVLGVEPTCTHSFTLNALYVDGQTVTNYTFDVQNVQAYIRHRLEVPLTQSLAPGGKVTLQISYTLILSPIGNYTNQVDVCSQIYGYSALQINLVDWYPFIAPYINGKWVLHNPWYYGEHLTYDASDFDVTVKVNNGANVVIASSGEEIPSQAADSHRYTLEAGRAFALSFSDTYEVASKQVGDVTVYSYYFPIYKTPALAVLDDTALAVQIYSQKFGPYIHKTLSVVQGDFNDGMEYSALYFHSKGIYNNFDGTYKNHLTAVSVHETAHQWWFEQVGNDQGLEPWLDESLATYSEIVFYEQVAPDVINDWWWTYRLTPYKPAKPIDISIYDWYGGETDYWNMVYLNGAHFLVDLRARIGDEAFFAFLQDYLKQEQGKIATADDFFRILREHTNADLTDLIAQYFQTPH